jgi:long-chain fatty acid transport protein
VGNRNAVTVGARYSPGADLSIDIAYGYLWEPTTSVNQANITGVQPSYSANYHNSANVIAAQISYRF